MTDRKFTCYICSVEVLGNTWYNLSVIEKLKENYDKEGNVLKVCICHSCAGVIYRRVVREHEANRK